jgi:hypothetical protein
MEFRVLLFKKDDVYVAHCLELDIVATSSDIEDVKADISSLIETQVAYATENCNMENLFHFAPQEIWNAYYECEKNAEKLHNKEKKSPLNIIFNTGCDSPLHLQHA